MYCDDLAEDRLKSTDKIMADVNEHLYLFTGDADNSHESWLEQIGCFSPVIHLQQSDGESSKHLPFTEINNKSGVVTGEKVLSALKKCYDTAPDGMQKKCDEIYLTIELFFASSTYNHDIIYDYAESVEYWRRFVPEDGKRLDQLVALL